MSEQLSIPVSVADYRAEQMAVSHKHEVELTSQADAESNNAWEKTQAMHNLGTKSLIAAGVALENGELTRYGYENVSIGLRETGNAVDEAVADSMDVAEGNEWNAVRKQINAEDKQTMGIASAKLEVSEHLDAYREAALRDAQKQGRGDIKL